MKKIYLHIFISILVSVLSFVVCAADSNKYEGHWYFVGVCENEKCRKTISSIPLGELNIEKDQITFITTDINGEANKSEQHYEYHVDETGSAYIHYTENFMQAQKLLINKNNILIVPNGSQQLLYSRELPHVPGSSEFDKNAKIDDYIGDWKVISYLEWGLLDGKPVAFFIEPQISDEVSIREKHLDLSVYGYLYRNLPLEFKDGKLVTIIGNGNEESGYMGILLEKHTDGYLVVKVMPNENTQLIMVFEKF